MSVMMPDDALSEPEVSEEELAAMRAAAHEMKKPYAARDIAEFFAAAFEKFSDLKKIHGR